MLKDLETQTEAPIKAVVDALRAFTAQRAAVLRYVGLTNGDEVMLSSGLHEALAQGEKALTDLRRWECRYVTGEP